MEDKDYYSPKYDYSSSIRGRCKDCNKLYKGFNTPNCAWGSNTAANYSATHSENEYLDDKNQINSEHSVNWQRWEGEDAQLVCKTWGNVYLWVEWEDIIHSFGAYDSHDRVKIEDFKQDLTETFKVFEVQNNSKLPDNSNIENVDPIKVFDNKEHSLLKKKYFDVKNNEFKITLDQLENMKNELKLDYESSQLNIKNTFNLIREVINNKEREISETLFKNYNLKISEINQLISDINAETKQFSDVSAKVSDMVNEITEETHDQLKLQLESIQVRIWKAFAYSSAWPDLISLWVIADDNLSLLPQNSVNDGDSENAYVHDFNTKSNIEAKTEKRNKSGLRNYKGRGLNKVTKEDYSYVSTKSLSRRSSMCSNNEDQNTNNSMKKDDKGSQSTQFIENKKVLNSNSNKYVTKAGSFTNRYNSDTKNKPKSEYI